MARKIEKVPINFFCVYCRTRKKIDKYFKVNRIKNKYIIDVKKMLDEENLTGEDDKIWLKIIVFNKIEQAMLKNKDIYFIPDFDNEFSIVKLLNLRKILGQNNFNVLVFHDEMQKRVHFLDEVYDNLSKFDSSQIIRDY